MGGPQGPFHHTHGIYSRPWTAKAGLPRTGSGEKSFNINGLRVPNRRQAHKVRASTENVLQAGDQLERLRPSCSDEGVKNHHQGGSTIFALHQELLMLGDDQLYEPEGHIDTHCFVLVPGLRSRSYCPGSPQQCGGGIEVDGALHAFKQLVSQGGQRHVRKQVQDRRDLSQEPLPSFWWDGLVAIASSSSVSYANGVLDCVAQLIETIQYVFDVRI